RGDRRGAPRAAGPAVDRRPGIRNRRLRGRSVLRPVALGGGRRPGRRDRGRPGRLGGPAPRGGPPRPSAAGDPPDRHLIRTARAGPEEPRKFGGPTTGRAERSPTSRYSEALPPFHLVDAGSSHTGQHHPPEAN